jgi:hypothetical protein
MPGFRRCAEEDSNLHPLSVDQALNLVTRVSDPSYASISSRTSAFPDAMDVMDDLDVAADVATDTPGRWWPDRLNGATTLVMKGSAVRVRSEALELRRIPLQPAAVRRSSDEPPMDTDGHLQSHVDAGCGMNAE